MMTMAYCRDCSCRSEVKEGTGCLNFPLPPLLRYAGTMGANTAPIVCSINRRQSAQNFGQHPSVDIFSRRNAEQMHDGRSHVDIADLVDGLVLLDPRTSGEE